MKKDLEISSLSEAVVWMSSLNQGEHSLYMVLILLFSLIPILVVCLTSFVKFSVVLSALRNALGAGSIPSASLSTVLALILTCHVMSPEIDRLNNSLQSSPIVAGSNIQLALALVERCKLQSSRFLRANTAPKEKLHLRDYGRTSLLKPRGRVKGKKILKGQQEYEEQTGNESFLLIVTAFLLTELREAFLVACLIFLPFLIIDLVVSSLLAGMGMMMVSPMAITLPIKLGVFALSEGWLILTESLVLGYQ